MTLPQQALHKVSVFWAPVWSFSGSSASSAIGQTVFIGVTLVDSIGKTATFWLYGVIAVCAIVFFALKVPETKGRSLEEIQEDVTNRSRRRRAAPRTQHA